MRKVVNEPLKRIRVNTAQKVEITQLRNGGS